MKILFLSHGSLEYDGRLRELVKVSNLIGETKFIIRKPDQTDDSLKQKLVNKSFPFFILYASLRALLKRDYDVVFIDNRKASVPGLLIKKILRKKPFIQDVRELYLPTKEETLSRKVGNFFESKLIKKSEILIAANSYRADIMKDYYKLEELPLVYENIRRLNYSSNFNHQELTNKYKDLLNRDTYKIISTSGHVISRTNDELVKSMKELGDRFELLLVGGGSNKDKEIILNIIEELNLNNVSLIKKVNEDELKFLIRNSHLGIVNYHNHDLNNRFCASGKVFEFFLEGLPVVSTENEPLIKLVADNKLGVSNNNYAQAIKEVYNSHNYYVANVKEFVKNISADENNLMLADAIKLHLIKKMRKKISGSH